MRAKFKVDSITEYELNLEARLRAINSPYSTIKENQDFTMYTPSGDLRILIDKNCPAATFLKVGKAYYLDFTEAPNQ